MIRQSKIQKNDKVIVTVGKDKGKISKVLKVIKKHGKVLVEATNMVKRHTKPNPQLNQSGGIIEKESAIDMSNVMILCTTCNKGVRIGSRIQDGKKERFCKKCNKAIEK